MKRLLALFLLPALCAAEPLLFVYFKEPANMGVFFATSTDGYNWKALNNGKPWIPIEFPPGELMRDPFITRGPDGEFHMVWTWAWRGTSLGYAHSPDLIHWSEHREIPIMAGTPGTNNTWAPEIYWDAAKSKWLVIWSSVVAGRHDGNRLYKSWTADFKTFSTPEIFYDPGYWVIDATILETRGKYYLVFKDERAEPLHKYIKIAEGDSLEGPWRNMSEALTESWSEGPSAIQVGNEYIIYYDHYRDPRRYEAVASTDLKKWTTVTDKLRLPEASKHGSFLKITEEEMRRIEAAHGSPAAAVSQRLPDMYHDEKHGDPPYLTEAGWRPLLNGRDLKGWHPEKDAPEQWFTSPGVVWKRVFSPTHLTAKAGVGDRIVNGKDGKAANLITDDKFGSFELYLEFMLAKGSNSGVFLHGLYEIQVFDTFGFEGPLTVGDCGGIYEQPQGGGGSPPSRNAARPPGEWQSLRVWFQGPQFDRAGKLMAKPKILRVLLNEVPVQENFTVPGPTLSHLDIPPAAKNPIMLQGDHGPVAYRNIYIRELD